MNRTEYMNADTLTNGAYDGSKGHDVHHAYFSQFVNSWITDTVLERIGKKRLLASRDVHLNDIPLKLWDDLPMTRHIEEKARGKRRLFRIDCTKPSATKCWPSAKSEHGPEPRR